MIKDFTKGFQSIILNVYRIISFAVLSSILIGVLSYVSLLIFYAINSSWASPLILSPTQEKVLNYQITVATLVSNIDKQEIELSNATMTQAAFKEQLKTQTSLLSRAKAAQKEEAADLMAKSSAMSAILAADRNASLEPSGTLHSELEKELKAGIISRVEAAQQRATYFSTQGTLAQWAADAKLSQQTAKTLLGGAANLSALTSELQIQQLATSLASLKISVNESEQTTKALRRSLDENRRILAIAKQSPYYKAVNGTVTAAFVPYDNLGSATVGAPVYDCYFQIFACRNVGKVLGIYNSEDYARHPLFRTDQKGKLVEIAFTRPESATSRVIFLNRKPLLF